MFATITGVIQYRKIAVLVVGLWLGWLVMRDIAVTQNFAAVDRFLDRPESAIAAKEVQALGHDRARVLLRHNAGQENNFIFRLSLIEWGFLLAIEAIIFFSVRTDRIAPRLILGIALILILQTYSQMEVNEVGRAMDGLPAGNQLQARFWKWHGIYSGAEIVKLLAGLVLAIRLCFEPKEQLVR